MPNKSSLTAARLRELFNYDPETGFFYCKKRRTGSPTTIGDRVGGLNSIGYVQLRVDNNVYLCHRLAWLYVYGTQAKEIDHIDGDRANNRLSNLRLTTSSQNKANRGRQKNNSSGYKGVCWDKKNKKWCAHIMVSRRNVWLGRHSTALEAHEAYKREAVKIYGEFARW